MVRHFDLVSNDFERAVAVLLGRVHEVEPDFKFEWFDGATSAYRCSVMQEYRDAGRPDLQTFARLLDGSYISSTAVHEDDDCRFAYRHELPFLAAG